MTAVSPSLVELQRLLNTRETEINSLKEKLTGMESRLLEEQAQINARLDKMEPTAQLAELRKELDERHAAYMNEIAGLRAQLNDMLGAGAYLSDITHKGKRPMWTYMAQALIQNGGPMTVEEIAEALKKLGYSFEANNSNPPNRIVRAGIDAQTKYFRKIGQRGDSQPVRYEVIMNALPKPGEKMGQEAAPVKTASKSVPTVAGTPVNTGRITAKTATPTN